MRRAERRQSGGHSALGKQRSDCRSRLGYSKGVPAGGAQRFRRRGRLSNAWIGSWLPRTRHRGRLEALRIPLEPLPALRAEADSSSMPRPNATP